MPKPGVAGVGDAVAQQAVDAENDLAWLQEVGAVEQDGSTTPVGTNSATSMVCALGSGDFASSSSVLTTMRPSGSLEPLAQSSAVQARSWRPVSSVDLPEADRP